MNERCPGCRGHHSIKDKVVITNNTWYCSIWCSISAKNRRPR